MSTSPGRGAHLSASWANKVILMHPWCLELGRFYSGRCHGHRGRNHPGLLAGLSTAALCKPNTEWHWWRQWFPNCQSGMGSSRHTIHPSLLLYGLVGRLRKGAVSQPNFQQRNRIVSKHCMQMDLAFGEIVLEQFTYWTQLMSKGIGNSSNLNSEHTMPNTKMERDLKMGKTRRCCNPVLFGMVTCFACGPLYVSEKWLHLLCTVCWCFELWICPIICVWFAFQPNPPNMVQSVAFIRLRQLSTILGHLGLGPSGTFAGPTWSHLG